MFQYGSNSDGSQKFQLIDAPCTPPFKLRWKAREQSWVRNGQIIAVCEANGNPIRLTTPCSGRLVKRRYPNNFLVEEEFLVGLESRPVVNEPNETEAIEEKLKKSIVLCEILDEPCQHLVVVSGLCPDCGEEIQTTTTTESLSKRFERLIPGSSSNNNNAPPIKGLYTSTLGFLTTGTDIAVSKETARALELEKLSTLILHRKLPLVLDLDNTLVHTYANIPPSDVRTLFPYTDYKVVNPNAPELQVKNPNYKTNTKDDSMPSLSSKLSATSESPTIVPHYIDDPSPAVQECIDRWESYVISIENYLPSRTEMIQAGIDPTQNLLPYTCHLKLRPGVLTFLRKITKKFELYLFTAGTALHTAACMSVLDPQRRWFSRRLFTREDLPHFEEGILGLKSTERIFPSEYDTSNLVTVIDDCDHVWTEGTNVIKIHPYHYWPDPRLHPFLLLLSRKASTAPNAFVPIKLLDPEAFTRIRAASSALLNFCPSVIRFVQLPKSPATKGPLGIQSLIYDTPPNLDGGHSGIDARGFLPSEATPLAKEEDQQEVYEDEEDTKDEDKSKNQTPESIKELRNSDKTTIVDHSFENEANDKECAENIEVKNSGGEAIGESVYKLNKVDIVDEMERNKDFQVKPKETQTKTVDNEEKIEYENGVEKKSTQLKDEINEAVISSQKDSSAVRKKKKRRRTICQDDDLNEPFTKRSRIPSPPKDYVVERKLPSADERLHSRVSVNLFDDNYNILTDLLEREIRKSEIEGVEGLNRICVTAQKSEHIARITPDSLNIKHASSAMDRLLHQYARDLKLLPNLVIPVTMEFLKTIRLTFGTVNGKINESIYNNVSIIKERLFDFNTRMVQKRGTQYELDESGENHGRRSRKKSKREIPYAVAYDEVNRQVLSEAIGEWRLPNILQENDRQLLWLQSILEEMHKEFFRQLDENNPTADVVGMPNCKTILRRMRRRVLQGIVLKSTGIREPSIPDFRRTDFGQVTVCINFMMQPTSSAIRELKRFGARLLDQNEDGPITHLIVGKETDYYFEMSKKPGITVTHLMWLEAALYTFRRFDEKFFNVATCERDYRVFWDGLAPNEAKEYLNRPIEMDEDEYSLNVTYDHTEISQEEKKTKGESLDIQEAELSAEDLEEALFGG